MGRWPADASNRRDSKGFLERFSELLVGSYMVFRGVSIVFGGFLLESPQVGSYVGGPASYKLPMSLDGSTRSLQPMGLAPERVRRPSVAVAGKTVQAAVRLMPAAAKVPVVPQVPQVAVLRP